MQDPNEVLKLSIATQHKAFAAGNIKTQLLSNYSDFVNQHLTASGQLDLAETDLLSNKPADPTQSTYTPEDVAQLRPVLVKARIKLAHDNPGDYQTFVNKHIHHIADVIEAKNDLSTRKNQQKLTVEQTDRLNTILDASPAGAMHSFYIIAETMTASEMYYAAQYARGTTGRREDVAQDVMSILKARQLKLENFDREQTVSSERKKVIAAAIRAMEDAYTADDSQVHRPSPTQPATISQLRDNTLWYRISDWTKSQIAGRLITLVYALLCGISIHASYMGILSQDIEIDLPGEDGATTTKTEYLFDYTLVSLIAALSALISATVNMKGFWTNVSALIDDFFGPETDKSPKGANKWAYRAYSLIFALTLAVFTTALTLTGVRDTLGITGQGFWPTFFVPVLFGGTFIAIWGLFAQEQRKWFAGTPADLWNRTKELLQTMLGLKADPKLLNENELANTPNKIKPGMVVLRGVLFITLTVVMSYFAYVMQHIMSDITTMGLGNFFHEAGMTTNEGNFLSPANGMLGIIFIMSAVFYSLGTAKRLADVGVNGLTHAVEKLSEPAKHRNKVLQGLCVIVSLCTVIIPFWHFGKFLNTKRVECLAEAKEYAHQERIKGSVLPDWLNTTLRFLFLCLPLAVVWNAGNNGGLFLDGKLHAMREAKEESTGQDEANTDLKQKQHIKAGLLTASSGFRSLAFGLVGVLEGVNKKSLATQAGVMFSRTRMSETRLDHTLSAKRRW